MSGMLRTLFNQLIRDDSSVGCLLKKVLVVDDETDIAEVVKRGLELQGMQVDAFNDPQKALEHFKPNTYEVVVLDIRMPRMNGFQLYREIMKRDDKARVLFITAFEESPEEFRKAFPELDAHRFMRKPFTISMGLRVAARSVSSPRPTCFT